MKTVYVGSLGIKSKASKQFTSQANVGQQSFGVTSSHWYFEKKKHDNRFGWIDLDEGETYSMYMYI